MTEEQPFRGPFGLRAGTPGHPKALQQSVPEGLPTSEPVQAVGLRLPTTTTVEGRRLPTASPPPATPPVRSRLSYRSPPHKHSLSSSEETLPTGVGGQMARVTPGVTFSAPPEAINTPPPVCSAKLDGFWALFGSDKWVLLSPPPTSGQKVLSA